MSALDAQIALVTGSTRGIGAATAAEFARHGAARAARADPRRRVARDSRRQPAGHVPDAKELPARMKEVLRAAATGFILARLAACLS